MAIVDAQNIGFLPEKRFYGTAKANSYCGNMRDQIRVYVAHDLDDDNTIRFDLQNLAKDPSSHDAYRSGSTVTLGDNG
jgi:hypothetical protein